MAGEDIIEGPIEDNAELEAASGEEKTSLLRQPLDLAGIFGFGLYLAWFYLTMTSTIAADVGLSKTTESLLVMAFLIGEVMCAFIIAPCANAFSRRRVIRIAAVVALLLLAAPDVVCIIGTFSETVFFAAWGIAGVGALVLLSLWGFFLSQLLHRQALAYVAFSALFATLLFSLVKLGFRQAIWPYANILIAVGSVVLFFYWATRLWSQGKIVYPSKTRPPNVTSLLHTAGAMVANSFLLGFGFYAIGSTTSEYGPLIMIAGMVGAAIFKTIDVQRGPRYQVSMIIKVIAPVAAIVLLLMPFVPVGWRYALVAFMLLFAMIDEIMCWTAVSEYMRIHQVHPFANMAFGRFGDIVGLIVGFECASKILGTTMEGPISFGLLTAIIVIAFGCLQAFFFRDNYTPLIADKSPDEDLEAENVQNHDEHRHGSWTRRCHLFAEHYGLTPRQTEVLLLVAKGYSLKSIEEQLVVSNHTVKAHVYSIYQKADVHSRQELMGRIAQFEDDGERPDE